MYFIEEYHAWSLKTHNLYSKHTTCTCIQNDIISIKNLEFGVLAKNVTVMLVIVLAEAALR
jgi:hypothetical protein